MKKVDKRAVADRITGAFERLKFTCQVIADDEMEIEINFYHAEELLEDLDEIRKQVKELKEELKKDLEEEREEDRIYEEKNRISK